MASNSSFKADTTQPQDGQQLIVPVWINGSEETTPSTFGVISPLTNKICWKAASATDGDAIRAIEAAQAAFTSWSQTKPTARQSILFRAADLLEARIDEYAGFMQTEMGAERSVAADFVLPWSIKMLRDIGSRIPTICGSIPVCEDDGRSAIVYKEPYGVVLGIVPWNAPYVFGIRAAATAIATGNTAILKVSELTPRCYWAIGQIFSEAGLPPGVLNTISCQQSDAPQLVKTMIEHPAVRKVNFTGSSNVGRKVARTCGESLKPCLMELGGKNSAIILPDADVNKAAKECTAGSFLNSGQICMATDRIIIHSSIASSFLAALTSSISSVRASSPTSPNVVSCSSKSRIKALVSDALSEGAHMFYGNYEGPDLKGSSNYNDAQMAPAILGDVTEKMAIWQEELFGPVVSYVLVQNEDEAVQVANKTGYGLAAAVFTRDLRRGFALAKRLESGAVHINSMTVHDEPTLPFGGVKNSGWGRFNASSGMEEFLLTKTVTWDD